MEEAEQALDCINACLADLLPRSATPPVDSPSTEQGGAVGRVGVCAKRRRARRPASSPHAGGIAHLCTLRAPPPALAGTAPPPSSLLHAAAAKAQQLVEAAEAVQRALSAFAAGPAPTPAAALQREVQALETELQAAVRDAIPLWHAPRIRQPQTALLRVHF